MLIDRVIDELACDKVLFDNELGGYLATRHLLRHGHRSIACLVNARRTDPGRKRLAGYARALEEFEVPFRDELVFDTDYYIPAAYEAAGGIAETDATAVFASSDNIALGLLKRLYEEGRRVPRDLLGGELRQLGGRLAVRAGPHGGRAGCRAALAGGVRAARAEGSRVTGERPKPGFWSPSSW